MSRNLVVASRARRNRAIALLAVVSAAAVTRAPGLDPTTHLGDTLWAAAAYLAWGIVAPGLSRRTLVALAGFTAFTVEFAQLYHTPRLDAIRASLIGRLTLGTDFDPFDLPAYLVGIALVALVESRVLDADRRLPQPDLAHAPDDAPDR